MVLRYPWFASIRKIARHLLLPFFCLSTLVVYMTVEDLDRLRGIKLFLLGISIDLLWVWYIQSTATAQKIKAAALSVGVAAPGLLGVIDIYDTRWLFLPYLTGLFCGTYLAIDLKAK